LGGNDTIDGGLGADEVDYRRDVNNGGNLGVIVNLSTAAFTADGVTVQAGQVRDGFGNTDTLTSIENARGTESRDSMLGSHEDNWLRGEGGDDDLRGGLGNDTLDGGAGRDRVDYRNATGAVTVNLATGTATGADGSDILIGIESIRGSAFADTLIGGGQDNHFAGAQGNDTIDGGGGFDTTSFSNSGGAPAVGITVNASDTQGQGTILGRWGDTDTYINLERITGSEFADVFNGGAAADEYVGGAGNDTIRGGGGRDMINYDAEKFEGAPAAGVTVNLQDGTATDSWGHSDTISGFERVRGTDYADTITGHDSTGDELDGRAGNDHLMGRGGAGNDYLEGGLGEDVFRFGAGTGRDTIGDFWAGDGATDVIDLSAFNNFSSFQTVFAAAYEEVISGVTNTVINLNNGDAIVLAGVSRSSLRSDDFWYGTLPS
jgi:Ca2+-binding RTX toxin-like protein